MRRLLYFYPENPLKLTQGNNARALALLRNFREQKIIVTLVGERSHEYNEADVERLKKLGLIEDGFFLKRSPLLVFLKATLPKILGLPRRAYNRARFGQQRSFNAILQSQRYDIVLISYMMWASLVRRNSLIDRKKTKLLIDTHDFLTPYFQGYPGYDLGRYFRFEMESLRLFDSVLAISSEEKYLFEQFVGAGKVVLVSHAAKKGIRSQKKGLYDIVYVASDNDHNKRGATWFFNEVYPLLPKNLRIVVIGRIMHLIPNFANVEKLLQSDNIGSFYAKARLSICPLFSGTGLKIKVVEALAYGLPVVTTTSGLVGFADKNNNGCLASDDAVNFARHITKLMRDQKFYKKIQREAQSYFEKHFSEKAAFSELNKILQGQP